MYISNRHSTFMNEYSYARVRERVPGLDSTAGLDTTAPDQTEYASVRLIPRMAYPPTSETLSDAMTNRRGTSFQPYHLWLVPKNYQPKQ